MRISMKVNICTVVGGKTIPAFLKRLKEAEAVSDMVELRVDTIEGVSAKEVELLKKHVTKEAIFTCREKTQGGEFTGNEELQREILKKADELGFDYIDMEHASCKQEKLETRNAKLISSFHNFQKTPPYQELKKIVRDMKGARPYIIKIATMVASDSDKKILYRLLLEKKDNERMIVVGMGEKGKDTRFIAPLLGSYLTYAAMKEYASAPGQIDIKIIQNMYRMLNL